MCEYPMTTISRFTLLWLLMIVQWNAYGQGTSIVPAGDWRDTQGNLIAATEGGVIKVNDLYYLWGMDRSKSNYTFVGVNVYSSPDLVNWKFENQVLKSTSHADLGGGAVVERAKILHNKKNNTFVMWMHYEGHNAYSVAEVAYATSPTITGNFTFRSHFRPLNIDSRDLNVYQDDNGKGYLICTTKGNQSVSLFELDDAYTGIVKELFRGAASDGITCEGHAIVKTGGYYFWLMSSCTGWDFNDNHYYYATTLAGPWKTGGNIAGKDLHTYESQVGFAFPVQGTATTTFVYMGDRWSVNNYAMSRIVMLPITVSGTKLTLPWHDQWSVNLSAGSWSPGPQNFTDPGPYKIIAKNSGKALQVEASGSSSALTQGTYKGGTNQQWKVENLGGSFFRLTNVSSGKVIDISDASREVGAKALQYTWNGGYNQKWHLNDLGNGYYRMISVNTLGKALQITGNSNAEGAGAELGNFSYLDNQQFNIVSIHAVTAVDPDLLRPEVQVYADPASGQLSLHSDQQVLHKITLSDAQGKELFHQKGLNTHEITLSGLHFEPGIYFIRMDTDKSVVVKKMIW